jgi:tRNA-Thr(GGU) m(6)t(6)A37 methyltransferase TsaA
MLKRTTILFLSLSVCLTGATAGAESDSQARFLEKLQDGKPVTIVTMGTSLTAGSAGWPVAMMEWLDAEYPGKVTLHNLAVGGSASQTVPAMQSKQGVWKRCGLDRLTEAIACDPDVVFIEFAVNDAFAGYEITKESSRANLETIIQGLLEADPNTEIILQTMNPAMDTDGRSSASDRPDLAAYYQGYRDVAEDRSLLLIDHYVNWTNIIKNDPNQFLAFVPDGIHPNLKGCREIILPELKAALDPVSAQKNALSGDIMSSTYSLYPIGQVSKNEDKTFIVLDPKYQPGLLGLDGFSHVHVFWWFDKNDNPRQRSVLQVHPRGNPDNPLTGVFATRAPVRPNLLAMTLCKIISIQDNVIEIESIDAFDQTPVLDLKPYIPPIDSATNITLPEWVGPRR